uniref:Uncharacterized protein n=2 Tax=Canis lupus familiaris TaxID=9615 RepID=A0A8I3PU02_CANLF
RAGAARAPAARSSGGPPGPRSPCSPRAVACKTESAGRPSPVYLEGRRGCNSSRDFLKKQGFSGTGYSHTCAWEEQVRAPRDGESKEGPRVGASR